MDARRLEAIRSGNHLEELERDLNHKKEVAQKVAKHYTEKYPEYWDELVAAMADYTAAYVKYTLESKE
jgi:hypothetical protein